MGRDSTKWIVLTLSADGRSLAPQALGTPESLGPLAMRELVRSLGGRAEIRAGATGGTVVDVRIPPPAPVPSA